VFCIAMAPVIRYRETHANAAAPVDGHIGNSVMPQFGGPLAGHYGCEAGAGSVRAWCGPNALDCIPYAKRRRRKNHSYGLARRGGGGGWRKSNRARS
jgi:hypothetical protein